MDVFARSAFIALTAASAWPFFGFLFLVFYNKKTVLQAQHMLHQLRKASDANKVPFPTETIHKGTAKKDINLFSQPLGTSIS